MKQKEHLHCLDSLRGFAVLCMVFYHGAYNLHLFDFIPSWLLLNPLLNFLQPLFAGIFIVLSGVVSRFSRSNARRGARLLVISLGITLVTWLIGVPILFGVLHFLAVSILLYSALRRFWDKMPLWAAVLLCVVGFVLLWNVAGGQAIDGIAGWLLFPFGWFATGFRSADYYPLLPWIFLFFAGTSLGAWFRQADTKPAWFRDWKAGFFAGIGRRALLVYLLHQPILYGLTLALHHILGDG